MGRKRKSSAQKNRRAGPVLAALGFACGFFLAGAVQYGQREGTGPRTHQLAKPLPPAEKVGREFAQALSRAADALSGQNFVEAFRLFTEAKKLAPADPRPLLGLGEVYRAVDRDQLAERAYREALKLWPRWRPAQLRLADVLSRLGKTQEAERIYLSLEREGPIEPMLWVGLARNAVKQGRPREAIPWIRKYNAYYGPQPWGYAYLGKVYEKLGNWAEAERLYRAAIQIKPRTTHAYLWLGQLLNARGRKEEAEKYLRIFVERRKLRTRIKRLQRALLARPNDLKVILELARACYDLGDLDQALQLLGRARKLAPGNPGLRRIFEQVRREFLGEKRWRRKP